MANCETCKKVQFQSTLPAGGATGYPAEIDMNMVFQSTLPAGGATITAL